MTKSCFLKIPVICFLVAFASSARGQERVWTTDNGNFKIEAAFIEALDGNVKLRKSDGRVIKVPLSRFSKVDQNYLNKLSSGGSSTSSGSTTKSDGSGLKGSGTKGSSSKLPDLNVSGQAQWSQDQSFNSDGKEEGTLFLYSTFTSSASRADLKIAISSITPLRLRTEKLGLFRNGCPQLPISDAPIRRR